MSENDRYHAAMAHDDEEDPTPTFLRVVAEGLRNVPPAVSGLDGYHIERLEEIASKLEGPSR